MENYSLMELCAINNQHEIIFSGHQTPVTNKDNLMQLSNLLQLSLETDKILQLFFNYIKHHFKLTNLLYQNNCIDASILLKDKVTIIKTSRKHNIKFELFYQDKFLGNIEFISKIKLTPNKIIELKEYINLLILPIKNSMLYSQAVKETRTDPLTKTGNKLALLEDLKYHFSLSNRYNSPLSVLFIDIDYFKIINDRYGHYIGDQVLTNLGSTLKSIIRKSDTVYRFGGEEFVIILENTNQNGAINLAKKIKSYIKKNQNLFSFNSNIINLTLSMGIATKQSNDTEESLIKRSDDALYTAKNKGRNCFVAA
jgi:diguanylate cyclase (GGDEF)-like protein